MNIWVVTVISETVVCLSKIFYLTKLQTFKTKKAYFIVDFSIREGVKKIDFLGDTSRIPFPLNKVKYSACPENLFYYLFFLYCHPNSTGSNKIFIKKGEKRSTFSLFCPKNGLRGEVRA